MLIEPRHDLDEVTGSIAVIELMDQNLVPGVTAGAGRAWQAEDVGGARDPCGCPRLNRRRSNLLKADHQKERRKRIHLFFEQRLDRFRGYIAAGKPGPARRDDN